MTHTDPAPAAIAWSMCLVEPLMSPIRRAQAEDGMLQVALRNPAWAATFYGGFLADIVRSLPEADPWRHLSGRIGSLTTGNSPARAGAWTSEGVAFGTYLDALDIVPAMYPHPEDDPALVALRDPLPPESAALIAFAAHGWRHSITAHKVLLEMVQHKPGSPPAQTVLISPAQWAHGRAGHVLRDAAREALVWAIHRRRSYTGRDDPWPSMASFQWSWRTNRIVNDLPWPEADVEAAITEQRLDDPPPAPAFDDDF